MWPILAWHFGILVLSAHHCYYRYYEEVRSLCIRFCKCQHTFFFLQSCLWYANDFNSLVMVAVKEMDFNYSLYSIVSYVYCLCTDVTCCKGRLLSRISFNMEVLYICVYHAHACMCDLIFKCKQNGIAAAIALFKRKELVFFFLLLLVWLT